MKPIKLLLVVLPNTSWDDPQMEGQKQLQRLLLYLLGGGSSLLGVLALLRFFEENWSNILPTIAPVAIPVITMLVIFLFLRKRLPLAQRLGREALRLRAAAEGEDDQLAPLATEQPEPLSTEEPSADSLRLGPLLSGKNTTTLSKVLGIVCIFIPLVAGAIAWITAPRQPLGDIPGWLMAVFFTIFVVIICIPFVYGGIQSLQWAQRTAQDAYVQVDEHGIHWQRPQSANASSHYSIYWKQARSFFMIAAAEPGTDKWIRSYALDAHSLLLTWQISHRSSAQERAASDMLCRLIVTHTRLPLRDLSAAAEQISRQVEGERQAGHHHAEAAQQTG